MGTLFGCVAQLVRRNSQTYYTAVECPTHNKRAGDKTVMNLWYYYHYGSHRKRRVSLFSNTKTWIDKIFRRCENNITFTIEIYTWFDHLVWADNDRAVCNIRLATHERYFIRRHFTPCNARWKHQTIYCNIIVGDIIWISRWSCAYSIIFGNTNYILRI